jgi:hypothetical protein
MSSTGFPINDLLRRKLQTSLTVATLTLSVSSTLFLLLFSTRLGLGIDSATGTLTQPANSHQHIASPQLGYRFSNRYLNSGFNRDFQPIHTFHRHPNFCRRSSLVFFYCFFNDGAENPRFRLNKGSRVPKQPSRRILHDRTLNNNSYWLRFRYRFRLCGRFCSG